MSRKTESNKVRIVNPLPGEARFTSIDRAVIHCEKGAAKFTPQGLFFFDDRRITTRSRQADVADAYVRHYRSNVVFWNGESDPLSRHRPGEVVS